MQSFLPGRATEVGPGPPEASARADGLRPSPLGRLRPKRRNSNSAGRSSGSRLLAAPNGLPTAGPDKGFRSGTRVRGPGRSQRRPRAGLTPASLLVPHPSRVGRGNLPKQQAYRSDWAGDGQSFLLRAAAWPGDSVPLLRREAGSVAGPGRLVIPIGPRERLQYCPQGLVEHRRLNPARPAEVASRGAQTRRRSVAAGTRRAGNRSNADRPPPHVRRD